MKIIDISWPLQEGVTEYKDKNIFRMVPTKTMEEHGVRESVITCGTHTGTHIDAPSHFLPHGNTSEHISLDALIGVSSVIDCTDVLSGTITREILMHHAEHIEKNSFVLLKTPNSMLGANDPFNPSFIYLDHTAAQYLVEREVRGVGVDYLGIERNQPQHETHVLLLRAGIIILEGLRLGHVTPGIYELICLPVALCGVEAAPARAVLVQH